MLCTNHCNHHRKHGRETHDAESATLLQDAARTKSRPGGAQPVDHDPDVDKNQSDVGPRSTQVDEQTDHGALGDLY